MAYESPLTIADVITDISMNKYVLPAIQREFVWETSQIERLFDSVMQGYPFGAFLFWEFPSEKNNEYVFYTFLQNYHEKKKRHNSKINLAANKNAIAVLDGQQRLTALNIGLTGSYAYKMPHKQWKNDLAFSERKLYLNIVEPAKSETNKYQFSFLTEDEKQNDDKHFWFKVGKILNMSKIGDVMKFWANNIVTSQIYTQEQSDFANDTLSQLYNTIHTQPSISYYKVKSPELDRVLQIFVRVNSGGTVLSYSDLLLSIATAQWKNLDARKEITEFVDYINELGSGFNVNKDFILKAALVLSDFNKIAFKVDNFNKQNMLTIEQNWELIKKSITQAFLLVSSFGFSRDSLTSNNAVIPIAYYLMTIGNPNNFELSTSTVQNRKKIKKWLSLSLLKKTFGGHPDDILKILREIIQENGKKDFPIEKITSRLKGTNKSIIFTQDDIEYILDLQCNRTDTLNVLMMLYPSLDFNNKFHIDHIYPKSKFSKKNLEAKGVSSDKISEYVDHVNDIENLQLLAAIPNIEKQDEDFNIWFSKNYVTDEDKTQYRLTNYMPDMNYSYANFLQFLAERRSIIKEALFKELL